MRPTIARSARKGEKQIAAEQTLGPDPSHYQDRVREDPNLNAFMTRQDSLHKIFFSKLMGERNYVLQAVQRTGPIGWRNATKPSEVSKLVKGWKRNKKDVPGSTTINCWESVLYAAYQAQVLDAKKCIEIAKTLASYGGLVAGTTDFEKKRQRQTKSVAKAS